MAKATEEQRDTARPVAKAAKPKRFIGGDYDFDRFNLTSDQEYHKQGYVASADVRALLDELGLHERKHIAFPMHVIKRAGNESWSLRIEPQESHQVGDTILPAHHWVYQREQPESVANNN